MNDTTSALGLIPEQEGEMPPEKVQGKKRKRRLVIVIILVLLASAVAVSVWYFNRPLTIEEVTSGWFYDQSAEEIQAEIDRSVQDGYFNMTINTSVPVYEGSTAKVGIQNISANHFDCTVTITLDDGTVVYESGGLSPGQELDVITLNQALEQGQYDATASFKIYDQNEEHTQAGQTASKITLFVQ